MYLFFDTETTGLPRNWSAPPTDSANWPRLVQIAWILCDEDGGELEAKDFVIRPDGFSIPADATRIHGITNARALSEGVSLPVALEEFAGAVQNSLVLVAHNMSFDRNVVSAELVRLGFPDVLSSPSKICTKEVSTDYCRLPGSYGRHKWPTLEELHLKLFDRKYEDAHNATIDVRICAKCFFELQNLGVIDTALPSKT